MNVEIAFDEKRGKVIITGNKKDVTDCVLAMYQTIEGTKSKNFEVEPGRSELLKTDRIIKYIGRKMKQQGLSDVWEVEKETVILFGDDENDFDKMENIIRNALGKVSVSLAKAPGDLLSTAKWKTIERDLRQKSKDCLVVEYQRDKKELVIFTTSDMEDQVQDAVEEFCEKNSIYKEEFSVEAPIAKFMEKHLKSNFTGDLDRLKSNGLVKWEVHANGSIKVEGSSESVQKAKEILNGIARSVHCGPLEIQKRFVKHYFESREGHDSLKTVEASVPCVIEERGSNFSKTVRMGKHQAPQQTFDRPTAEVKGPMSGRSSKHAAMPQSPRNTDDDSISFTVYAETSQNVAKAKKQLESTVMTDWKKKEMHDMEIPSLNRFQIKELQDHARNNHCHITIIPEKEYIEMVGLVSNISDVQQRVFEILRKVDKYKHERENAEVLASIVQWVIIKEGKQMPFMKNENRLIEQAFKAKEKDIKLKVRQTEYKIDFVSMKEWDISSPKTQYDVLRRDPQKETSVQMPSHWANMRPDELVKTVKLQSSDMEYQKVEKEFLATLAGQHNIASIERVQNPTLYTQYMAKKKQMEIANKGTKMNERMLWHGTAHSAVPSIGAHGFNRFYCGKNLTAIGQGVYFATDANYSAIPTYSPPDSSGYKRMYRCLVLTGEYTTGNDSMRTPPPKNPSSPHILYDSVTNYSQSPSMFVIFNDTQAYPEHLITFK
ncbi:protein mono-ADP-ribosyltransferase PARP14-like isoform X1 [Mya arenaria]|nr:protein mono-ADP-ribosyltransferase PARP14-like isoform X1 [Mya arenaria]